MAIPTFTPEQLGGFNTTEILLYNLLQCCGAGQAPVIQPSFGFVTPAEPKTMGQNLTASFEVRPRAGAVVTIRKTYYDDSYDDIVTSEKITIGNGRDLLQDIYTVSVTGTIADFIENKLYTPLT
jgi:hypothetical protein